MLSRRIADELFECVDHFVKLALNGLKFKVVPKDANTTKKSVNATMKFKINYAKKNTA